MSKLYILGLIGLAVIVGGLAFAEELTLTTYYPAPYGVYNVLRLAPQASAPATPSNGDLYVGTDNHIYCYLGIWKQLD